MGAIDYEMEKEQQGLVYGAKDKTHECYKGAMPKEAFDDAEDRLKPFEMDKTAEEVDRLIRGILGDIEYQFKDKLIVMMQNKRVWFDRRTGALFPQFDQVDLPHYQTKDNPVKEFVRWDFDGFSFEAMTEGECKKSFIYGTGNPYLRADKKFKYFKTKCESAILLKSPGAQAKVCTTEGKIMKYDDIEQITLVPICRLAGVNSEELTFGKSVLLWWENGLVPEGMKKEAADAYIFLMRNYDDLKEYILDKGTSLAFNSRKFLQDVKTTKIGIGKLLVKGTESAADLSNPVARLRKYLCDCDYVRANIKSYDPKRLTDPNAGHWELFEPVDSDMEVVELPENAPFFARPPQKDVNDGIVAIDFGTKSTVVVRHVGTIDRLMRVGQGAYDKTPTKSDYENPTVIELRDFMSFYEEYAKRAGRPFTKWDYARFSHDAANALKDSADDVDANDAVYYSIFSELKQWANDPERHMNLKDRQGKIVELNPYLKITDKDFDPIELYAYYLGLYINNMHNGICLEYMLSFPVTYEDTVRERILQSFEKGIKKSLPPAILNDQELMEEFEVSSGSSEPAAYASCALGELGLEPEPGAKTAYAVFDFGGGTTDFDFGIESVPENNHSQFVIDQLEGTSHGDPYLGGENLLNILAYEVYRDEENVKLMRELQIPFILPHGCEKERIAASESILFETKNAPQEAYINIKRVVEKVRLFWEAPQSAEAKALFNQQSAIALFSGKKNDGGTEKVTLKFNENHLNDCLYKWIRRGIDNFFEALKGAFEGKQEYPIHILLAGNSCKSHIVHEIFREKIDEVTLQLLEKIEETSGREKEIPKIFELHPPLGFEYPSDESESESELELDTDNKKNNAPKKAEADELSQDFDRLRTGKTGVAFGLIRSRKGGHDVKILEHKGEMLKFLYYIGSNNRGNFHVDVKMDVPINQWIPFTFADSREFEIYYTKEASSVNNSMAIEDVFCARCKIDKSDVMDEDDAHIYLRKVSVDTIEYTTAKDSDFASGTMTRKVYTRRLSDAQ